MSNYLVTGAAGFIGGAVARRLLERGDSVVTIDNLSTGTQEKVPSDCVFIKGNDFDTKVLEQLEKYEFDAIIHIAGQSSGEISYEDPVYDLQTNVQSTLMLLQFARRKNVKKFIYASSMSVYGDVPGEVACETDFANPKSFYAVGKLASENYMKLFTDFGINSIALRFFNVYGIGQNMENMKQGMASIYLSAAIKYHHILVKGSKERFRDFVYIDDIVESVILSLDSNSLGYNCYNVATGTKTTVEEVVECIRKKLDFPVTVEYVEGTPGDQFGIYGNAKKIEDELGWKPKVRFDEGMQRMVAWAIKGESK